MLSVQNTFKTMAEGHNRGLDTFRQSIPHTNIVQDQQIQAWRDLAAKISGVSIQPGLDEFIALQGQYMQHLLSINQGMHDIRTLWSKFPINYRPVGYENCNGILSAQSVTAKIMLELNHRLNTLRTISDRLSTYRDWLNRWEKETRDKMPEYLV